MNFTTLIRIACVFVCISLHQASVAHNGKIAYARPIEKINVDGNLSDWPLNAVKYPLATFLNDTRPTNASDYSGFFQVGYNVDGRSLYIAFTIMDDNFIEDTSANVRFDSQDCLELCLDGRHLPVGSGVASFMYSKKLKNTNQSKFDPFASAAKWDMIEVAMTQKDGARYYEWKINLGPELKVGKSVGLDVNIFDKDSDGSFTIGAWGRGDQKFRNPSALGDIVLLPANRKMSTIAGQVGWDRPMKETFPGTMHLRSVENPSLFLAAAIDSTGAYSAEVPAGKYEVTLAQKYIRSGPKVYAVGKKGVTIVTARPGEIANVAKLVLSGEPAPDLLPDKGILLDFNPSVAAKVDEFVETYRDYYDIPGVSLALIKDGKVVYHKTYGYSDLATGTKVDNNTLFEAASITKPVFSFAVHRLAERGVIDLDRPLYLYLPYEDIAYDERYKLITARHVLTHRTGFPNWRWMNSDQKLNLRFTPGTDYNYSGEGFEYLKMVVEKITGKKVEQVLKEEVIEPMGLYHTFFSNNDSLKRMVAKGHYDQMPTYDDPPESPGMAYSMHTEAKIFTNFMLYMLEQKGLKSAYYDTMFSKHSEYKFSDGDKPKYPVYMGMSLEIRETPFGKTFGHGGNNGDFTCHFEVFKDIKAGYAIFTNSNTSYPLLWLMKFFLVEGKQKE